MMQQHEEGLFLSHTSTHVRLSFNLTSAGIQENRTRSHCIFVAFSRRISDSNEMLSTSCYYNDHFARCHSVFFFSFLFLLFMHQKNDTCIQRKYPYNYECKSYIATSYFRFVFLHSFSISLGMQSVGN